MTFKTYADITDDDLNISYDPSIVDATELKLDSKDNSITTIPSTMHVYILPPSCSSKNEPLREVAFCDFTKSTSSLVN
ncbi:hypothetical protein QYZ88_011960 [Lachnospiraceae bacterium C1.1]|nr:hypothetical protein [Lachnospiraceae bacterium C1.1]